MSTHPPIEERIARLKELNESTLRNKLAHEHNLRLNNENKSLKR